MRASHQSQIVRATTATDRISSILGRHFVGRILAQAPGNPSPALFRTTALAIFTVITLLALTPSSHAQELPSLLTMIASWQYPGSKIDRATMGDAETLDGAGERTVPSIQYKTVLTTQDPMPKVIEYYRTKLASAPTPKPAKPAADSGRSVTFHDDSEGRPVAIHVIVVNTDKASTTLVISRAAAETETHIAWTHYRKL